MLTDRQLWMLLHIGLSAAFLHGFVVGTRALLTWPIALQADRKTVQASMVMTTAAWLTVITGTWTVYAWYRAEPTADALSYLAYPKAYLVNDPDVAVWHEFAMEWKEHVGWLSPILATAAGVIGIRHRSVLRREWRVRRLVLAMLGLALFAALVAAVLGAAINKVAPNQFLGS